MPRISRLQQSEVETARALVYDNYLEAQKHTPDMPVDCEVPELSRFLEDAGGIAYAAWEDDRMVGYMGFLAPFDGFYGPVWGSFSPLHGHAVAEQNRARRYSRLYEAAAADLVGRGVTTHAIVLHATDAVGIKAMFMNGFGMRMIDAIRRVEPIAGVTQVDLGGVVFEELNPEDRRLLLPLHNGLSRHLNESPSLLWGAPFDEQRLLAAFAGRNSRHFIAREGQRTGQSKGKREEGAIIAYMELTALGENFTTFSASTRSICGAYMYPEYRGTGIYTALLNYLIATLQGEGFTHLGVDFESFNPTARGFWLKYFTPTTYEVTRRIDERILRRET